jgi:hypothetical protein
MKAIEGVLFLSISALALFGSACEPVSVPPWPYTIATDGGAADDGASSGASAQGTVDASAIEINYGVVPLRCDGGLCNTDNYSLCNIADRPAAIGTKAPLLVLAVGVGIAIARKRNRRKTRRSS